MKGRKQGDVVFPSIVRPYRVTKTTGERDLEHSAGGQDDQRD